MAGHGSPLRGHPGRTPNLFSFRRVRRVRGMRGAGDARALTPIESPTFRWESLLNGFTNSPIEFDASDDRRGNSTSLRIQRRKTTGAELAHSFLPSFLLPRSDGAWRQTLVCRRGKNG